MKKKHFKITFGKTQMTQVAFGVSDLIQCIRLMVKDGDCLPIKVEEL